MVAFIPILAGILAIVGIGQVFKPRLPQYTFQINQLPMLKYINGSFKTRLGAGVKLQNDNYVPIDVHSLSFDLYYPNHWSSSASPSGRSSSRSPQQGDGSDIQVDMYEFINDTDQQFNNLVHIGQVQDKYQQEATAPPSSPSLSSATSSSSSSAIVSSTKNDSSSIAKDDAYVVVDDATGSKSTSNSPKEPLWEMLPRQLFETVDHVFMELYNIGHFGVMSSLSWDIIKSRFGSLKVPSSGVIQVKANKKLPLTMSIICDNILNTWTMEMSGISCQLSNIEMGWSNMESSITKLRQEVLTKVLHPNTPYNIVDMKRDGKNDTTDGDDDDDEGRRNTSRTDEMEDQLSQIILENGLQTTASPSSKKNMIKDVMRLFSFDGDSSTKMRQQQQQRILVA